MGVKTTMLLMAFSAAVSAAAFPLTENHVIVTGSTPSLQEKTAAAELREYLGRSAGISPDIVSVLPDGSQGIFIGTDAVTDLDPSTLAPDEIFIRTTEDGNIYLAGEGSRGTLYAVYTFLEDCAGIRWLAPDAEIVPEHAILDIPVAEYRYAPPFSVRHPSSSVFTAVNSRHCAHRRVNGSGVHAEYGGNVAANRLGMAHTMSRLVPDQAFYNNNKSWFTEDFIIPGNKPELYALRDGRRISGVEGQVCLTNPEVKAITIHNAIALIKWKMPNASSYHISQNDNQNFCQCPECTAKAEELGNQTDLWLWFLNGVADAIAEEFPGIEIETLAYQYTLPPPQSVIPRDNIRIRICLIEADSRLPFYEGYNSKFAGFINGWDKVSDNLAIWHYITNFTRFGLIHPNFRSYAPNMGYFRTCGIKDIYSQDSMDAGCFGFFPVLRSYLISNLLWNPDADPQMLTEEFINGYYGTAAPYIAEYLDLYSDLLAAADGHILDCYEMDTARWLPYPMLEEGRILLEQAAAAADNDEHRRRVEHLQVSHDWTTLYRIENGPLQQLSPWYSFEDTALLLKKTEENILSVPKTAGYIGFYVQEAINLENGLTAIKRKLATPFPVKNVPEILTATAPENLIVLAPEYYTPANGVIVDDYLACDRKAYRLAMGNHNWALRVDLPACHSAPAHVFAELRLPAAVTDAQGTALIAGFYTFGTNFAEKTAIPVDSSALSNNSYSLIYLGRADFSRDRQIYFEGAANTTVPEILLGRIWIVKE